MMPSTCFEPEGSSSGGRVCIQLWYRGFHMYRYKQSSRQKCVMRDVNTVYRTCIYNRLSEDEPSDSKRVQDIVKIKILFIIQTNKFTTYIHEQYFTYSKHCYMFRYIFIIFRQCYPSTVLILQISFRLQTQYNQYIKMFTYVIVKLMIKYSL